MTICVVAMETHYVEYHVWPDQAEWVRCQEYGFLDTFYIACNLFYILGQKKKKKKKEEEEVCLSFLGVSAD